MLHEMDNRGAVDFLNNLSVGGRTRHVDVRNQFLRDLKDEGLLIILLGTCLVKRTKQTFSRRMQHGLFLRGICQLP